jgi:hypothetical protein
MWNKIWKISSKRNRTNGWRTGLRRVVDEVNLSMIHFIPCRNFCKYCNVCPPSTIKKGRKRRNRTYEGK